MQAQLHNSGPMPNDYSYQVYHQQPVRHEPQVAMYQQPQMQMQMPLQMQQQQQMALQMQMQQQQQMPPVPARPHAVAVPALPIRTHVAPVVQQQRQQQQQQQLKTPVHASNSRSLGDLPKFSYTLPNNAAPGNTQDNNKDYDSYSDDSASDSDSAEEQQAAPKRRPARERTVSSQQPTRTRRQHREYEDREPSPRKRATQIEREGELTRMRGCVDNESELPSGRAPEPRRARAATLDSQRARGDREPTPGDYLGGYLGGAQQQNAPRNITVQQTENGGGYNRGLQLDPYGSEHRSLSGKVKSKMFGSGQHKSMDAHYREQLFNSLGSSTERAAHEQMEQRRRQEEQASQPLRSPRKRAEDAYDYPHETLRSPRKRTDEVPHEPIRSPRRRPEGDRSPIVSPRHRSTNNSAGDRKVPTMNNTRNARQPQSLRSPRGDQHESSMTSPRGAYAPSDQHQHSSGRSYGPVKHPFQGMPHTDSDSSFYNIEYRMYLNASDNGDQQIEATAERCMRARATINDLGILIEDDTNGDFIDAIAMREVDGYRFDRDCGAWILDVTRQRRDSSHSNRRRGGEEVIEYTVVLFSDDADKMHQAYARRASGGRRH